MNMIDYEVYKEALNSWHVPPKKLSIMEPLSSLAIDVTNIDKNTASTFNFSNSSYLKNF